jgi:putative hydrolase of the HAD superfamily
VRTNRGDFVKPLAAVTFDCWNTLLVDHALDAARALRVTALIEVAGTRGVNVDDERALAVIRAAHLRHVELWSRGIGSTSLEMAGWSLEALDIRDAALVPDLGHRFEEAGLAGSVAALPGAGDALEALRGRGVRTALVCDTGFSGGRVVRHFLSRVGLLDLLEVQIFSNEIGVPKPDRRMFVAALEPLGVAADAAVHVGDLKRTDVQGGRSAGMGTVRIRAAYDDPDDLPEADAVTSAHADLIDALATAQSRSR